MVAFRDGKATWGQGGNVKSGGVGDGTALIKCQI